LFGREHGQPNLVLFHFFPIFGESPLSWEDDCRPFLSGTPLISRLPWRSKSSGPSVQTGPEEAFAGAALKLFTLERANPCLVALGSRGCSALGFSNEKTVAFGRRRLPIIRASKPLKIARYRVQRRSI